MKKNLLLLMLALLLPAFMYGQEQTVSGTVLDTYKMGVPGASIVEKGTTNGTITDFDGNYTLTVSNKNATLVFSFIVRRLWRARSCEKLPAGANGANVTPQI